MNRPTRTMLSYFWRMGQLQRLFSNAARVLCLATALLCTTSGCKMTAPMRVWKAPEVPKAGKVRVAVAPIGGKNESRDRLMQAMQQSQPNPNPLLAAVYPDQLTQIGGIQLVSFDTQPNEMALLASARRAGLDYVLQGNVVDSFLEVQEEDPNEQYRFRWFKKKPNEQYLTVHWTVVDVGSGQRVREKTISMNRKQADKLLGSSAGNPYSSVGSDVRVLNASAQEAWSFVAPNTQPVQAMLDLPWVMAGSSQVRKGNGYARQGNWEMAEREWQSVADQHPWNKAAWTNLSLAAVAKEDFILARERLKHADTFWPGDSTSKTLHWIEERQRDYHQSLELAPPPEGWSIPTPMQTVMPNEVPSSPPRDLKDMPWWTAIPFIPPPGWTWKQWWTQPIVL